MKGPRGESLRYIIIGGCTTLIDYLAYYGMVLYLHIDVHVSNVGSATLAILFAYVTNKFFVFVSHTSSFAEHIMEFLKFIASRLFTLILEFAGVKFFVDILGQDFRIGKAETIVVVIIANYFLSKYIVFRKNTQTHLE